MIKNALEGIRWLLWLGLQRQTVDARERARDVVGAALGQWVAGGLTWWGRSASSPWLAATMGASAAGASAVLLFAVPSSPLAQPWPVMVGNVMSALVGVAVYRWLEPRPPPPRWPPVWRWR